MNINFRTFWMLNNSPRQYHWKYIGSSMEKMTIDRKDQISSKAAVQWRSIVFWHRVVIMRYEAVRKDCGRVTEKSTWSPIRLCNILMTLSPTYSSTAPLYAMLVTTDPPSAPPENQVIPPPTNPPAINSP